MNLDARVWASIGMGLGLHFGMGFALGLGLHGGVLVAFRIVVFWKFKLD